jgi:TRAP-type C4-dicarboxylate transport system permease small subunit
MSYDSDDDQDNPDLSKIIQKVNEHVDTRMEYLRLLFAEKTAIIISKMSTVFFLSACFLLFFLFTNIAAAFWIGKHFNDYSIGFGSISLFYLLLAIIYLILRNSVFEKKIQNIVLKSLYPENDEDDEDAD